jgi:hypothetical protein
MFAVLNDPLLHEFTGGSPPNDVESPARLYERWETRKSPGGSELWYNWALQLRAKGQFIGFVQATVAPEYANIAWVVGSRSTRIAPP